MQRYINGVQQNRKQTVPLRDSIGYYQDYKIKKQFQRQDQKIVLDVLSKSKQNNVVLKQNLCHIYDTLRKHQSKLDYQSKQVERLKRELDKVSSNTSNSYINNQYINSKEQKMVVNKRDYEGLIQQNKELKQVIELMLTRIKQLQQLKGTQACTKLTLEKQSQQSNNKLLQKQKQKQQLKIQD